MIIWGTETEPESPRADPERNHVLHMVELRSRVTRHRTGACYRQDSKLQFKT